MGRIIYATIIEYLAQEAMMPQLFRAAHYLEYFKQRTCVHVRKMKLLTHNMLTSHVKGVKNGYPLVVNVRMLGETKATP